MQLYITHFLLISLIYLLDFAHSSSDIFASLKAKNNIVYLSEKSSQTIRLKSILNLNNQNLTTSSKSQKLFWSFKRIYSLPNLHGTHNS